jgi:hypothetical protein
MVHPQRMHHFPDDYAFSPEKGVLLRRHYSDRAVDLVPRRHGRAALENGKNTWVYPSVSDALQALTGWTGEGAPPGSPT